MVWATTGLLASPGRDSDYQTTSTAEASTSRTEHLLGPQALRYKIAVAAISA